MIDLHMHSSVSDGKLSPTDIARRLKELQITVCALTDHDTVDGLTEFAQYFSDSTTRVLFGAELTALYGDHEIHLLAYQFEIEALRAVLARRKTMVDAMKPQELLMTSAAFRRAGFVVSDTLKPHRRLPIGLTVAQDVYRQPANRRQLVDEHGSLISPEEFFARYQAPGQSCYVPRSGVDLAWIVANIRPVVGDLIVAHPRVVASLFSRKLEMDDLQRLVEGGCTGVEVYHAKTSDQEIEELREFVTQRHLSFTGGSDNHGRVDDTPYGQYGKERPVPKIQLRGGVYE